MNRKEYYNRIDKSLKDGINELTELHEGYKRLVDAQKSGAYTLQYRQSMFAQIASAKRSIDAKMEEIKTNMRAINDEYTAILRREDSLNPADITEDSKLFTAGVELTARDLQDIIARNPNNRTMAQLCVRYAKEKGIEGMKYAEYTPAEDNAQTLDTVYHAASTVLKYYDNPDVCNSVYNTLLGEGTGIYKWCNE